MKAIVLVTFLLGLCMSVALAACGGEDGKSSANGPSVQQGQFPPPNGGVGGGGTINNGCQHEFTEEVLSEADCEQKGEVKKTCSVCGESIVVTIPAKGHKWSEYQSDRNGTPVANGTQTATCQNNCGKTNTIEEPDSKRENGIWFKSLHMAGNNVTANFENEVTMYSFLDEVQTFGNGTYTVTRGLDGSGEISTKTLTLDEGDNVVYVWEYVDGSLFKMYTVTLHRRAMFTVTFVNEGSVVETQSVLEGNYATPPTLPEKAGYTFKGWSYDCTKPITEPLEISALWEARTDTKYTVEYYYENIADENYTCTEILPLTGTTDETATADIKDVAHFTYNAGMSTVSGNVDADGSRILKVYYDRNEYGVTHDAYSGVSVAAKGNHKYGTEISTLIQNVPLGTLANWYAEEERVPMDGETYVIDRDLHIRFETDEKLANFTFTSTATACTIKGIKDKTVTEIVLPDYVTRINEGAFNGCSQVVSMELPFVGGYDSAAKNYGLLGYVFGTERYTNATNVSQKYYTNSSTGDYSSIYYYFPKSLRSVTVGGSIIPSCAFYGCNFLSDITIKDGVQYINEEAFCNCSSLTSITIPDSVNLIRASAFYGCESLKEATIPKDVTAIPEKAFYRCWSLEKVTFDGSVKTIGANAFEYCRALRVISLPDSVTSIGEQAFNECTNMVQINIPKGVTTIGNYAFGGCSCLIEVYNASSLTLTAGSEDYGRIAYNAKNVYTPTEGASKLSEKDGYVFYIDGAEKLLVWYTGKETALILPSDVSKIYNYAFARRSDLTSVKLNSGLTEVGNYAFNGCSGLKQLTLSGVDVIGIGAFGGCIALETLNLNGVTTVGSSAFQDCDGLKEVVIPGTVETIENSMFRDCGGLERVTVENGVQSIVMNAFLSCGKLNDIVIADSVTEIDSNAFLHTAYYNNEDNWDSDVLYIGKHLIKARDTLSGSYSVKEGTIYIARHSFSGCMNLTGVSMPDSLIKIDGYAFNKCSGLTSVSLGNGVKYIGECAFAESGIREIRIPDSVETIDSYAFQQCTQLSSAVIGDGVTALKWQTFNLCSSLKSVTIGSGVTEIEMLAFKDCTSLYNISYKGTRAQWSNIRKELSWNKGVNTSLVVCTDGNVLL